MSEARQWVVALSAMLTGILIAWIDTRPGWDDTGVTVGLVLLFSFLWGAVAGKRAWLIAIAVGVWIPLANVAMTGLYASLFALVIAFIGAYAGALARRGLFPAK